MAAPMAPQSPTCPTCGTQATWHPQPQQWGCDRCRQMLGPSRPMAPPPNAITNPHHIKGDAGSAVGRVVIWIIVIVFLVIIKLAIRGQL